VGVTVRRQDKTVHALGPEMDKPSARCASRTLWHNGRRLRLKFLQSSLVETRPDAQTKAVGLGRLVTSQSDRLASAIATNPRLNKLTATSCVDRSFSSGETPLLLTVL